MVFQLGAYCHVHTHTHKFSINNIHVLSERIGVLKKMFLLYLKPTTVQSCGCDCSLDECLKFPVFKIPQFALLLHK